MTANFTTIIGYLSTAPSAAMLTKDTPHEAGSHWG